MADLAAAATPAPVSAQLVGNAFVQQYYQILHQSSGLVHRFYHDNSTLGRPEEDGSMSMTTTMDAINEKILSLNYGESRAEIRSVDSQDSLNGGVNVLVTGYLTGKDNISQSFVQSFLLAPQEKGYFVLNDMFRYVENSNHHEEDHVSSEDVLASETPEQVPEIVPVVENNNNSEEEFHAEKVVSLENGELPTEEEEVAVVKVVDELQDSTHMESESQTKVEDVPKKSYASIVMDMKQNGVTFSSPLPASRKPQPKKVEQHLNNIIAHTTTVTAEPSQPTATNVDAVENGIHEEEAEGYSVYIKGLPVNATNAMLEEEFKKFGPIKPNGIQVRSNWQQGFSFGFVEFETPEAVQKAIKASPITINGKKAVAEEKRSTNSRGGGNRGKYVGSGFRNDGMRSRGNYGGGRGYNRGGDFGGNRNEYGNRGGGGGNRGGSASHRGGNGYQRDNNGRVNRGVDVNGTTKATTQ